MIATTAETAVERKIVLALRVGVPGVIVYLFLWRILGIRDPTLRFFDDFFYYLVPAEHWVHGAGSTFFPGEPTSGYQPLWFLWVTLLYRVAGDGPTFFAALDLSLMALTVGFYFLFERFLRRLVGDALAAAVGAAVAAIVLLLLARFGLETALAVCAAALLLCYLTRKPLTEQTVRDAAVVGALGAFLYLSRLDSAVLLLALAVAVLPRLDTRRLAALAAGLAPAYLYLAFNWWAFGQICPTSMAAKTHIFYWPPNLYFLEHPSPGAGITAGIVVVAIIVPIAVLLRRNQNGDNRRTGLALAAALVLQLAGHALFSGWMLFPWYAYLTLMALGLAVALLVVQFRRMKALRRVGIPLGVVTLAVTPIWIVFALTPDSYQIEIAAIARRLHAFSVDHPGVYAVGDAAGTAGWLIKQPMVQLEGLMMSHAFVDRIRQRQDLDKVFRDYHVNYYVATAPIDGDTDGCHLFLEPNPGLSSPRSPHMAMTICSEPVAVIQSGMRRGAWIFRIDPATGRPS